MNYDNDFGIKQSISIVRSQACQALPWRVSKMMITQWRDSMNNKAAFYNCFSIYSRSI